jgi:hypothetical protein
MVLLALLLVDIYESSGAGFVSRPSMGLCGEHYMYRVAAAA